MRRGSSTGRRGEPVLVIIRILLFLAGLACLAVLGWVLRTRGRYLPTGVAVASWIVLARALVVLAGECI